MSIEKRRFDPYRVFNLDNFFDDFLTSPLSISREQINPKVDIKEMDGHYEIIAEVPGLEKEDVNIEINKDVLTIKSEKETKKEEKDDEGNYIYKERSYTAFQRQFRLPENANVENIDAKMDKGLLTIKLDKIEPEPAKKIEIK
ncbi:MAG: Hsp20/alpha crystallin family protein [Promethearchaeota archaeon]|nr:MAG: Hsp20/alpha crystallin family protein [Candidatus Lokiarchaeota archaeon]